MHHVPTGEPDRLLDSAAVAALQQPAARRSRWWVLVGVLAVLLTALPLALFALGNAPHSLGGNGPEHLLGRTEQVTAHVDAVQVDGHCRQQHRERFRIELSWTAGPPPGHSSYLKCTEAPAVGERLQAWVDSDGAVFLESPAEVWAGMSAIGLGLGLVTVGTGAVMLVPAQRRRDRLLAAAGAPLLPPVPVFVEPYERRQLGFRISPAPQATVVTPPMTAIPILYAAPGRSPELTSVRKLKGPWYFRAGPVTESGRQPGVLERGQERCWVEGRPVHGKARR